MVEITPSKLLSFMNQLDEVSTLQRDAAEIKKDISTEAKDLGISPKLLTKIYKAYKDPENYRSETAFLDDCLTKINI